MANIYELTADVMALQEMLEENPTDEVLRDTMEGLEGDYEAKMVSYSKVIKHLEADTNAIGEELARLRNKKTTLENNIKRMKAIMFESMKATGIAKIDTPIFKIAIQRNGGRLPIVLDCDVEELAPEFVKITKAPDMDALTVAIEINPNFKFAHFGERGESLRIK